MLKALANRSARDLRGCIFRRTDNVPACVGTIHGWLGKQQFPVTVRFVGP